MSRPAPPPLDARLPPCSICGEEVDSTGDGYECRGCDASWPYDADRDGEWHDPTVDQCPEEVRPYDDDGAWFWVPDQLKGRVYRCFRSAGHKGEHANPEMKLVGGGVGLMTDETTGAQHEIAGMLAAPNPGVPWAARLQPDTMHPEAVSCAVGVLIAEGWRRRDALMAAYALWDAGMLTAVPDGPNLAELSLSPDERDRLERQAAEVTARCPDCGYPVSETPLVACLSHGPCDCPDCTGAQVTEGGDD